MVTRATILLAAIFLLLPATALADITGAEIYLDDRPLNFLPADTTQVEIRVTTDSTSAIQANQVYDENAQGWTNQNPGSSSPRTITYTLQPEEDIRLVIRQVTSSKELLDEYFLDKTLPKDEQPPLIEQLTVNDCEENCYYSQQSKARIIIQDQGPSGVAPNTIYASFRGRQLDLTCDHEASKSICEGTINGQQDGELRVQATDRADNQGEEQSLELRYDNTPPRIAQEPRFIDVYGESGDVDPIPGGVPAIIEVRVNEQEHPTITLTSNEETTQGECEAAEEPGYNFLCTASFTPPNQNINQERVNISITDPAGNQENRTHTFRVMESDQETTPEFYSASGQALRRIDHETWAVNNITIPISVDLQKLVQATPQPLHVEIDDCDVKGASAAGAGKIRNSNLGTSSIQFEIEIPRQEERAIRHDSELLNNSEIRCEADLYSSLAGVAYTNPQRISFTIEPEFITALPPPREALQKQEEKAQERVVQIGQRYQKLQRLVQLVQDVCQPTQLLYSTGGALSGAAVPLYRTVAGAPAAEGLNQAGGRMTQTAEGILDFIGPACDMMQCKVAEGGIDWLPSLDGVDDAFATASGAENPEQLIDPYKSIVTAAATRCIPAVMYHYEQFRIIGCQEYECRQQVSKGRTSADACAYGAREATCNLVAGHIIHAIPTANIVSSGLDYYAAAVSSPLAMVGGAMTAICAASPPGEPTAWCRMARAGARAGEVAGVISNIDNYISEVDDFSQGRESYCSNIQSGIDGVDNRPFSLNDGATRNCRGVYSTYEHNGNKYIRMNEETCLVTEERRELTNLEAGEAAYGGISGLDINCRLLPHDTPTTDINDAHDTCIEDGFVTPFENLEAGQEAIQKYDDLKDAKNEREELEDEREQLVNNRNTLIQRQDSYLQGYDVSSLQDSPINTMQYWGDGELNFINRDNLPTREQILQNELTAEQENFINDYIGAEQIQSARQTQTEITDTDERLNEVEDERSLAREDIKELDKEARRAARRARDEAYQQGLQSGGAGFLKGMLGSMAGYGQLGATLDRTFSLGVADTGVGGAFKDASDAIAGLSDRAVDSVGNQICSVAGNNRPVREATIQTRDSRPVAHINGVVSSIGSRNNYRIDVGLVGTGGSGEVQVQLRGAGQELVEELDLASEHSLVGPNAIGYTHETAYTHACLVFNQDIKDIFGETQIRRDGNQRVICARLQENNP